LGTVCVAASLTLLRTATPVSTAADFWMLSLERSDFSREGIGGNDLLEMKLDDNKLETKLDSIAVEPAEDEYANELETKLDSVTEEHTNESERKLPVISDALDAPTVDPVASSPYCASWK